MDTIQTLPTRGQLERQLSQTLISLYRQQFGHLPKKITCYLFADKLAIVAEDTITSVEKILFQNGKPDLARSIRQEVSAAFTAKVKEVVTDILEVEVADIIIDSAVDTGYLGMIVFLNSEPQTRKPKRDISRHKIEKSSAVLAASQLFSVDG